MTHKERLQEDLERIECWLQTAFLNQEPRADLYDAMRYSLLAGGKRLRPVLLIESCRMCGGDAETVLPYACAVEMVHTYSLIHDDLPCMDDDDLRRGRATNHKVFGVATAVLAGDGLLNAAFETVLEADSGLPAERVLSAAACLGRASGTRGMVGGQALDMAGEGHALTFADVEELQRLKTGTLIGAAAEMGCILAGGGVQSCKSARRYAEKLGLAFQIRDDMLDVEGDETMLGKPVGSDAKSDKTTFVTLKGLESCRGLVERLTQEAKESLEPFSDTAFLCWLAESLVQREK